MAKTTEEEYKAFNSMLKPSTLRLLKMHAVGTGKKMYLVLDDLIVKALKPTK